MISKEELDQARAQRDADQAQVTQLTADLETAKLGGREDAIRAAQAAVESQRAALDKAKWSFDQKQQFAPTNAAVHDTLYRQGEFVAAGNPVVVLLPPENLKVRFFVPQEKLPQIKVGATVSVHADGAAHPFTRHGELHFHAGRIHAAGDFQPRDAGEPGVHDRGEIFAGGAADLRPGQPVDVTFIK